MKRFDKMKHLRFFFSTITVAACLLASAQYKAIILPTSDGYGQAFHAGGGQITGIDFNLGNILWNGPNYDQFVRLRTTGYSAAQIWDTDGGYQIGNGRQAGRTHALIWSGKGEPVTDLDDPQRFTIGTWGRGTDGITQVGVGQRSKFVSHAILWKGTAESAVDLNPGGLNVSEAYDCWGDYQVGNIELNTPVVWSGTAASMRRLPMPGGINALGNALAIYGNQIAGSGGTEGVGGALIWNAETLKYTILGQGIALDTNGVYQVGYTAPSGNFRALRWSGTPGSELDLHQFLPGFRQSQASGIDEDGTIVGWGRDADNNARAIAWVPVPEPGTWLSLGMASLLLLVRRRCR
jgi:hypothetical protein